MLEQFRAERSGLVLFFVLQNVDLLPVRGRAGVIAERLFDACALQQRVDHHPYAGRPLDTIIQVIKGGMRIALVRFL